MSRTCSVEGCGKPIEKDGKCILHCGKKDWYEQDGDYLDWSKSEEKIKEFWKSIRPNQGDLSREFKGVIFPPFISELCCKHPFWNDGDLESPPAQKPSLEFIDCVFLGRFFLDGLEFDSIRFLDCSFYGWTTFYNVKVSCIHFERGDIYDFLDLWSCEIGDLCFTNNYLHKDSRVWLRGEQSISKLTFSHFSNTAGEFKIENADISSFSSDKSNLNDMTIIQTRIGGANIKSSVVQAVTVAGTFFDPSKFDKDTDADIFRQFKFVYDKVGNYNHANHFYAAEMEVYSKTIKGRNAWVFCFGKFVSDHGQNWVLPFFSFLLLGFIFFVIPSVCLAWTTTIDPFPQYGFWKFINPLTTEPPTGYWMSFWVVYKALSAAIIYHIVVAFRRQTRR